MLRLSPPALPNPSGDALIKFGRDAHVDGTCAMGWEGVAAPEMEGVPAASGWV